MPTDETPDQGMPSELMPDAFLGTTGLPFIKSRARITGFLPRTLFLSAEHAVVLYYPTGLLRPVLFATV